MDKTTAAAKAAMTPPQHNDDQFPGDMPRQELAVMASMRGLTEEELVKQERAYNAKQRSLKSGKPNGSPLPPLPMRLDLLPAPQRV